MKALTAAEMREVDRLTTERCGIPSLQLMEAAGKHVADAVLRQFAPVPPQRVSILCGKGNNGGDGLVAARHLKAAGLDPRVYLFAVSKEVHGDAGTNLARFLKGKGRIASIKNESEWQDAWPAIASSEVIVDALLGTGLRGAATGIFARAIYDLNELSEYATGLRPALLLAVDTPSGLPSDGERAEGPVLRVHDTVTFTAPKISQLISQEADAVGALEVCPIGSPLELVEEVGKGTLRWAGPDEFTGYSLVRSPKSHKGFFGHVLLIAGSLGKSGAAILSGRAALRTGAGLVTIATPDIVWPVVAAGQPEYMTESLESTTEGTIALKNLEGTHFQEIVRGKTVLGIGPGLGTTPETQECIRTIVQETSLPTVLDADGLNAFASNGDLFRERTSGFLALTPHPGEMGRLFSTTTLAVQSERLKMALDAARRWNAHFVLKGYHTVVASPEGQSFVCTTGNAGLAKGGSGDVLTGILAALIAQFGLDDGARVLALGVYLHGLAAEIASQGTDMSGLLASEVADAVPQARLKLLKELRQLG